MSDTNTTKMLEPRARKTGLNLSILSLVSIIAALSVSYGLNSSHVDSKTAGYINILLDLLYLPILLFPLLGGYFLLQSRLLERENNKRIHTHLDLVLKYIRFLLIGFGAATLIYVAGILGAWQISIDSYMAFVFIILAANFYYYMISEEKLDEKN